MFFCKKVNRLVDIKKAEERFQKDVEKTPLEKKDRLAMILAALIVFVPAFLLVLAVFRPDLVFLLLPVSVILTHAFLLVERPPAVLLGAFLAPVEAFSSEKGRVLQHTQHLPFPNRAMGNYIL